MTAPRNLRLQLDRTRLVETAQRQADQHGWNRLTMTRLAAEVGVKTPSLYSHVDSLDSIRSELATRAMYQLGSEIRSAALGRSGEDGFRSITAAYRRFALQYPARYEAITAGGPYDGEFAAAGEFANEALRAILRSYGLEGDRARQLEQALWAAMHGFVSLEARGAFSADLDVDDTFVVYLDGMAAMIERAVRQSA